MNRPNNLNAPSSRSEKAARPPDMAARRAGLLLILTASASLLMVFGRVFADADQPTLPESLRAIAENRAMYATSAAARVASGIALKQAEPLEPYVPGADHRLPPAPRDAGRSSRPVDRHRVRNALRVVGQCRSGSDLQPVELRRLEAAKNLRRKLGDDASNPTYILTETRVGYCVAKGEATP